MNPYSLLTNGNFSCDMSGTLQFLLRTPYTGVTLTQPNVVGVKVVITFLKNAKLVNNSSVGGVASINQSIKSLSDQIASVNNNSVTTDLEGWYSLTSGSANASPLGTGNSPTYVKIIASDGVFTMNIYDWRIYPLATMKMGNSIKLTDDYDYVVYRFYDTIYGYTAGNVSFKITPGTNNLWGFYNLSITDASGSKITNKIGISGYYNNGNIGLIKLNYNPL
jgi:hypothetical protein